MDELRAEFEKRFPVPANCGWSIGLGRYRCDQDKVGLQATIEHIRRWEGYQACAESLRAELAAAKNALYVSEEAQEGLRAGVKDLAKLTGAFEPRFKFIRLEITNLQDALASERAANAKVRQNTIEECAKEADHWQEIAVRRGDNSHACGHYIAGAIRALSKAVPVRQELSDDKQIQAYISGYKSVEGGMPIKHLFGLRAVIAADRKLRDAVPVQQPQP